jgi:vancomycin resistance protein VanW
MSPRFLWVNYIPALTDLRTDLELPYKYHVFEKEHRFVKIGQAFYRRNELWREKYYKKRGGEIIETELIQKNDSLVKYIPDEFVEVSL